MKHLTLADEIVVLMLRDDTGAIRPECTTVANMAIAGGILMELALLGRIDTDLKSLFIVDPKPVGDELLDHALQKIAAEPKKQSSVWWIRVLGLHSGNDLSVRVLGRLVQAGILRAEDRQFLWVFSRRAYPQNTGREEREAKARLVSVIFNDDVPDSRDTLLLGLAESTGVLKSILSPDDMRKASNRIAQVIALEEINRSLGGTAARWRAALRYGTANANWDRAYDQAHGGRHVLRDRARTTTVRLCRSRPRGPPADQSSWGLNRAECQHAIGRLHALE